MMRIVPVQAQCRTPLRIVVLIPSPVQWIPFYWACPVICPV